LARKVLTLPNKSRQSAIMNLDMMPLTTFAVEAEHHITGPNFGVSRTKGGEPVRTVRSPVFIIADAYSGSVEKVHDEGGLAFLCGISITKVVLDSLPQTWQRHRELREMVELQVVAFSPELVVVAGLLATLRVAACGLKVAARIGRNPYIGPCRRDRQSLDTIEVSLVDHLVIMLSITESLRTGATNARHLVMRKSQRHRHPRLTHDCCICPSPGMKRVQRRESDTSLPTSSIRNAQSRDLGVSQTKGAQGFAPFLSADLA
jgi:hypothetical protein